MKAEKGFTTVELLISVALVAVIAPVLVNSITVMIRGFMAGRDEMRTNRLIFNAIEYAKATDAPVSTGMLPDVPAGYSVSVVKIADNAKNTAGLKEYRVTLTKGGKSKLYDFYW